MKTKSTQWLMTAIALSTLTVFPVLKVAAQANDNDRRTISVNGEALVYATPDKIMISLGIEKRDIVLAKAKAEANAALAGTLTAITGVGVKKKDIQTDAISIHPDWGHDGTFRYFIVRTTLAVTIVDPWVVNPLIEAALEAGTTHIQDVNFQTTELRKYRDIARDIAIKAAKEKAEKLAGALGGKVGKVIKIDEASQRYSPWYCYSSWSGYGWSGRDYGMSQNAMVDMSNAGGEGDDQTMLLGKIGIRANVSVTFEIE